MLSPNVMHVSDQLAAAQATINKVDAFAYASINTSIGKLSPDPDWLEQVRNQLKLLSLAGQQWQLEKPNLWAPILTQFSSYASLFSSFADNRKELGDDKDIWLQALDQLKGNLNTGANASRAAEDAFKLRINDLENVRKVMSSSIDKAWAKLGAEEEQMVALATLVTSLQDRVNRLQEDLGSTGISGGQNYISSSLSITYTLVSKAGVEVPYLSIVSLIYSTGKLAYDVIVADAQIKETIDKVVEARNQLSHAAQAVAMTKAVIQLIDNFDKSLLAVQKQLPALSEMWRTEKGKVADAMSALNAGAKPSQTMALTSMKAAAATWNRLGDFVGKLSRAAQQGEHIPITVSQAA
ncbi:MAG TPA: hypothetical protein VF546_14330 [Pyrinomonadaceae bacterium]|jgi:hypothetical protein